MVAKGAPNTEHLAVLSYWESTVLFLLNVMPTYGGYGCP